MFGIGVGELAVIAVVGLLVFGPERLPQMARQAGRFIVDVRKMIAKARQDLNVSANDLGLTEEDRELLRELRNPKSTMRQRLLGDEDFGLNEENLSLEESPKRKPSARPYDPARKKSTSPGASGSSRSTGASGSRAANGEQRRTGPKSNRTSTNGAPAQAESTPQAAGKADESGLSTTNPPVEGVNGSADAGAHVSTNEAPDAVSEAGDSPQRTPTPAAPPFDPDAT
ncbi:MAG TPA: Sec-independent protein translocase protein TatB [Jiangellaceae bacterium]|nr:Sec-independent protein translocase protein TatB [Jiangellaceae bacterium]